MLAQVRAMVPHGDWMKWLEDECPDIGYTTANSWIKIGSNSRILENLGTLKSLTEAYQIVGILPPKEDSKQIQATGTASVSIADSFANRFSKHCHRIVEHSTLIDFSSLGEPAKERLVSSIDELLKIREALTV